MSKAVRTILSLAVSVILISTLALAQAAEKTDKNKSDKEHHSRLSKAAFWRHHKTSDKNAKQGPAKQAQSQKTPAKTAQLKPVSAKTTAAGKQSAANKNESQKQNASKMSKPAGKSVNKPASSTKANTVKKTHATAAKSAATNDKKPRQKAQPQTVSLKQ